MQRFLASGRLSLAFTSVLLFLSSGASLAEPPGSSDPKARLLAALAAIERRAGTPIGVAAVHVETGLAVSHNGAARFKMASTFKLPVAWAVLQLADEGKLALDERVALTEADFRPSGPLAKRAKEKGVTYSIAELLEESIVRSDNTAVDVLLARIGGAGVVRERLTRLGVSGIDLRSTELELIAAWSGFSPPSAYKLAPEELRRLARSVSEAARTARRHALASDPRDTADPDAMAAFLVHVAKGNGLSPEKTALLLGILRRCETGDRRIRALLPKEAAVANKTGTWPGMAVSDVGLVTLPNGAGRVALAVYVRAPRADEKPYERVIAEVAKTVYDAADVWAAWAPGAAAR